MKMSIQLHKGQAVCRSVICLGILAMLMVDAGVFREYCMCILNAAQALKLDSDTSSRCGIASQICSSSGASACDSLKCNQKPSYNSQQRRTCWPPRMYSHARWLSTALLTGG